MAGTFSRSAPTIDPPSNAALADSAATLHVFPQASPPAVAAGCAKFFVGGLTPGVDVSHLQNHFGQYGEVVDAVVMWGKGFGFVTFKVCRSPCCGGQAIGWGRAADAVHWAPCAVPCTVCAHVL